MRSRMVFVGFSIIVVLALVTGSVLLVGYSVAAASLLVLVTLLVRRALRGRPASPIESVVSRWVDSEDREAA